MLNKSVLKLCSLKLSGTQITKVVTLDSMSRCDRKSADFARPGSLGRALYLKVHSLLNYSDNAISLLIFKT